MEEKNNNNGNNNDRLIRMETILDMLNDKLDELTLNYKEIPNRLTKLEMQAEQQQKEIDELYQKDKDKSKWIMGIVAAVVGGLIIAGIKYFVGI